MNNLYNQYQSIAFKNTLYFKDYTIYNERNNKPYIKLYHVKVKRFATSESIYNYDEIKRNKKNLIYYYEILLKCHFVGWWCDDCSVAVFQ